MARSAGKDALSMPDTNEDHDQSYSEAKGKSLGVMFAAMFAGMIEKGMTPGDALEVVKSYAMQVAANEAQEDA